MDKTSAALCTALALSIAIGSASANDPSTAAHDACVAGTWVQTGGGPGEWMQQHMPKQQAQVTFHQPRGVMVLETDGRYSAHATELGVDAIDQDPAGFRQSLRAQASASGRWSTRERTLLLEAETSQFTSSNDAITQAAERLRARHSQGAQRGRVFYGCRGNHLTTRTEIRPGETFPTHFVRVRADGG